MPDNDASIYSDLVGFLESERADLRKAAVEAVEQVTDPSDMEKLIKYGAVKPLCKLINREKEIAETSINVLLRLSSEAPSFVNQAAYDMNEAGVVTRVFEVLLDSSQKKSDDFLNAALGVLANVTRSEAGAVALLGNECSDRPMPLLTRFLLPPPANGNDPWQHIAGILMNLTQVEAGRKFVSKKSSKVLERLLPQLRSTNVVRRKGVAGVIKNICFDKDSAWWLLNEIEILKHLLYPLAGPEELDLDDRVGMDPELWLEGPDKIREPDEQVRLTLVESILLLLATGRASREFLRKQRTYVILKMADMVEENEEVGEKINECVQFLRRDEEGTDEGSSDRIFRQALPPTPASIVYGKSENFDDVD